MLLHIRMLSLILLLCLTLPACKGPTPMEAANLDGWNHFGLAGNDGGQVVALGAIAGGEADVIVRGAIVEVCSEKGCWMRLRDGEDELFVRFQDYAFFVPRNAAGRDAVIHGMATAQLESVETLRHYAEDAGKSAEEIAAITEPEMRITFYADAVYIEGDGLDAAHEQGP